MKTNLPLASITLSPTLVPPNHEQEPNKSIPELSYKQPLYSSPSISITTESTVKLREESEYNKTIIYTNLGVPFAEVHNSTRSQLQQQSLTLPLVREDPLNLKDSSPDLLVHVQNLISHGNYSEIMDENLVDFISYRPQESFNGLNVEENDEKSSDVVKPVHDLHKDGYRFLYTGKKDTRTRNNCYMLRAKDSLDEVHLGKIRNILIEMGGEVKHTYLTRGMKGFSVCFPEDQLPLRLLKSINGILWVERDQVAKLQQVQEDAPWQLSRISNPSNKDYMGTYEFSTTGKGVNIYVIDSGADVDHPEFGGRAKIVYTAFGPGFPNDCAGHGTQVSSVIGGHNVGIAKEANILVAQVLGCDGQGDNSSILAAINWVISNHKKPAVINMSVGGPQSHMIDSAVEAAIATGIPVVAAAGNSHIDACLLSPSGVKAAMVVGSSTMDNKRASFSNYGQCVDIFAPGKQVMAAAISEQASKNGFTFASGTSLSAPLVAGIYALILEDNPNLTPRELHDIVRKVAKEGILDDNTLIGSPNLFAQVPVVSAQNDGQFSFLAASEYPKYGPAASNMGGLELVLVCIGIGLVAIFAILSIGVLLRRRNRKRRELEEAKAATPVAVSTTDIDMLAAVGSS